MSFEEFQNRSRLYVIGALESEEMEEFERARKKVRDKRPKILSASVMPCTKRSRKLAPREIVRRD